MLGLELLDVAIGVIFVFLLVSVVCASIREALDGALKTRAAYLEHGIRELLHDRAAMGLAHDLYTHPFIYSLYAGEYPGALSDRRPGWFARGASLPSYIPARNFARALLDLAARGAQEMEPGSYAATRAVDAAELRAGLRRLGNPAVERVLVSALDSARGDLARTQQVLEDWFDSSMDRVSGMYKRSTQWIILLIACAVAVGLNINTITIADFLYRNSAARDALVARAEAVADADALTFDSALADLERTGLPIGWSAGWGAPRRGAEPGAEGIWNDWAAPVLGWLLTAVAATFGAPFWFDVLNKVMVIRATVKPKEKSPEESSEDRQIPRSRQEPEGALAADRTREQPTPAAPPGEPGTAPPGEAADPAEFDPEVDACAVVGTGDATLDEELPAAEGGVA